MKIVIFSGTTEGRELSAVLAARGAEVVVCVATEYGEEEQRSVKGAAVRKGPLTQEEKSRILSDAALCVDATHPYARHVTASVREACGRAGVEYVRLLRGTDGQAGDYQMDSAEEAAEWLREHEGRILLATGAKELKAYARLDPQRLFPRVLPSHEAISACEAVGIPHRNIIAMQGPFSRELNAAIIRQFQIRYVVSKDGGGPGGFPEKAAAARETGAELLVLRRPQEEGLSFAETLELCDKRLRENTL